MKKFKESVIKALLPHIIMTEAANRPIHGYALITQIRRKYNVYLGPSTIYPALNALEKEGLIRSEWRLENGERPRRVYVLTERGRISLGQTTQELKMLIEVKA